MREEHDEIEPAVVIIDDTKIVHYSSDDTLKLDNPNMVEVPSLVVQIEDKKKLTPAPAKAKSKYPHSK